MEQSALQAMFLATAATGQAITKNTTVSVFLVVMLVVATVTITSLANNMRNDIDTLTEDVSEIKASQATIIQSFEKPYEK